LGAGFEDYSDHEEELGYFAAYSKMKKWVHSSAWAGH
jgi:hypothetical protein